MTERPFHISIVLKQQAAGMAPLPLCNSEVSCAPSAVSERPTDVTNNRTHDTMFYSPVHSDVSVTWFICNAAHRELRDYVDGRPGGAVAVI